MGKIKKSFSLSMLSLLSCCLIGSGAFLTGKFLTKENNISVADVDTSISNTTPDWFVKSVTDNSTAKFSQDTFFPQATTDALTLKFDTIQSQIVSENNSNQAYAYYPGGINNVNPIDSKEFILFTNTSMSLSRDGSVLSLDGNKCITTTANPNATTIFSENFEMNLYLNTTTNFVDVAGNKITLFQEGVYTLTLSYTAYYVNDWTNEYTYSYDHSEVVDTVYTFRVFNYSTYLNPDNSPKLTHSSLERTQTNNSATQYNYFYNYQTSTLPEITYDPTKYSLTIVKNLDNNYSYTKLVYNRGENNVKHTETADVISNAIFDETIIYSSFNATTNEQTIRFSELGQYVIDFDFVYTDASQNPLHYTIPKLDGSFAKTQTVYVFGYQARYTQYDPITNTNTYPELKTISQDYSSFSDSADITSQLGTGFWGKTPKLPENVNGPVSTNQTPVKINGFGTLGSNANVSLYKKTNDGFGTEEKENLSKNYSEVGTYLAILSYTFDFYTTITGSTSNTEFHQAFYFTITNDTPTVDVETDSLSNLASGKYTNENVYITDNSIGKDYDSPVIIKIERTDFTTGRTLPLQNLTDFPLDEKGYKITENGNYRILIYYGRSGLSGVPITRSFTIDKTAISAPQGNNVTPYGESYIISNSFDTFTNQPFVLSWNAEKASGAKTYGYYKYYAITQDNQTWGSSELREFVGSTRNLIPSGYKLDLNTSSSWIYYNNTEGLTTILNRSVRSNAGLYVVELFDEAGNKTTKFFMLDNTDPKFVLYNHFTAEYSLSSGLTQKVSGDTTVYWMGYKGIVFTPANTTESDPNYFYNNKDGSFDTNIAEAYSSFEQAGKQEFRIQGQNKTFFGIEIDDRSYIKDDSIGRDYVANNGINSYKINYSYSLYFTEDGSGNKTYYYSSSEEGIFYEAVNMTKGNEIRGINPIQATLLTATAYGINGLELQLYNGTEFNQIIDMDSLTYTFVIRDSSNTTGFSENGVSLTEQEQYVRYPSASQRIEVSSDQSEFSFVAINTNDEYDYLSLEGTSAYSEDLGNNQRKKNGYYYPTSTIRKISVSFIPTIIEEGSGKVAQVESISAVYTPYVTQYSSTYVNGNMLTTGYKTWGTPESAFYLYNYSTQNQNKQTVELPTSYQIVNGEYSLITKEGKYEITRIYKSPDETYKIDQYDFIERTLTLYVDRYGVISSSEIVEKITTTLTTGDNNTFTYVGNELTTTATLLESDGTPIDGSYRVKVSLNNGKEFYTNEPFTGQNGKVDGTTNKYTFEDTISSIIVEKYSATTWSEEVTTPANEKNSSTQSVVGNGILVNMYSGNGNDSISVQFPSYNANGLNSGETFYTNLGSTPIFTTNKVPLTINIPSNKFTFAPIKSNNNFSSEINKSMSLFHDAITLDNGTEVLESSIQYYDIVATVTFTGTSGNNKVYTSKLSTDGKSLAFVLQNTNQEVPSFSEVGKYTISITQGSSELGNTDSSLSFRKTSVFSFRISDAKPDFTITNSSGKSLNGTPVNDISTTVDDTTHYFSNQKNIDIRWFDSASQYMANIDKENVFISYSATNYRLDLSGSSVKVYGGEDFRTQIPVASSYFNYSFSESSLENVLSVDTTKLTIGDGTQNVYNTQGSFSISMQFTGHNAAYYQTTSKTLTIDTSADSTRVDSLLGKLGSLVSSNQVRSLLNIDGNEVSSGASYNVTKNVGLFKNYSYLVDQTWIESLQTAAINGGTNNASKIFFKEITNYTTSAFEETNYNNFVEGNYDQIADFNFVPGYYEIVESDLAGNLTIYVVNYYQHTGNITFNTTGKESEQSISNSEVMTNRSNVYSYEGISYKNISFKDDAWLFFNIVNENNVTTRYMLSPWLSESAYNLATNSAVPLTSILDSIDTKNEKKRKMVIYDREIGTTYTIYISIVDTSILNVGGINASTEGINVNVTALPNDLSKVGIFPVQIKLTNLSTSPAETLLDTTNNPLDEIMDPSYSYSSPASWTNLTENYSMTYSSLSKTWSLSINNPTNNTKYKYEVTDNFGKTYTYINLYGSRFSDKEADQELNGSAVSYDFYENIIDNYEGSPQNFYKTSENRFIYSYNPNIYRADAVKENETTPTAPQQNLSSINRGTYSAIDLQQTGNQYNEKWKINVYEADSGTLSKSIYVHFYNILPLPIDTGSKVNFSNDNGISVTSSVAVPTTSESRKSVSLGGKNYYTDYTGAVYAQKLTLTFDAGSFASALPKYKATIFSTQNSTYVNGVDVESGFRLDTSVGVLATTYYILFTYEDTFVNEYKLYEITINNPNHSFFYVTLDGKEISPKDRVFTQTNGVQYSSNYYIVNVAYTNKSRVQIVTNEYQKVMLTNTEDVSTTTSLSIKTEKYLLTNKTGDTFPEGVSPYSDYVVISYIAPTTNPTSVYYGTSQLSGNLLYVSPEKGANIDSIELNWSSYYGIPSNTVGISAIKDGKDFPITTKTKDGKTYATFDISGTYELTFMDSSNNVKHFGTENSLTLVFVKDVHFTMEYSDANGNIVESEAIDKGVFNSNVKLKLQNLTSYYTPASIGQVTTMIVATKNGQEYVPAYNSTDQTFSFEGAGYYKVYFKATSLSTNKEVQEKTYSFTILNANESRYAYEFTGLSTYSITNVLQDNGIELIDHTDNNVGSTTEYLYKGKNSITISYYEDEGVKSGYWTVSVNTGKNLTIGSTAYVNTTFTFSFLIRANTPPIDVNLAEGKSTTKTITVSFRSENIYNTVGECIVYIVNQANGQAVANYSVDASTTGIISHNITESGKYYIQVKTTSGNLLYSYVVTKKTPLNTWAIVAIVLGCIAAIGIVFIVIRLRKRIRIK